MTIERTAIELDSAEFNRADLPEKRFQEQAFLIRAVEQRLLKLFGEGKLFGTVHTCIGQEWCGVAVAAGLLNGDLIFSNHRGHGHYLARTGDVDGLIGEVMGRRCGMCGGRGGSQHICSDGFYSNGIQGGITPVAAGLAFAQKLKDQKNITVVFIGDGTLGQGVLYETLNIASKWELPLLIVVENNRYSQSTAQHETLAGDICGRATAFGIPSARANVWETLSLMKTASSAVNTVRHKRKPVLLQIDTYRLMAHSKGDDDRDPAEVQSYWKRDPIAVFGEAFPDEAAEIKAKVEARVDAAVAKAESSPYAEAGGADVMPLQLVKWSKVAKSPDERMVTLLYQTLKRNMSRDESIVFIGEDICGPYGGAFKVTKDLSDLFPTRVRNTPISEPAIVGLGNGLALAGMKSVCEIMFGDFLTLCADQIINHASKFRYMYNGKVTVPLVIRTPMGGRRGYGPTHSQSIEKHFLGIPDVKVLALNPRVDPGIVYDRLFEGLNSPHLVIENKLLYGQKVTSEAPDGFVWEHSDEEYPTARLRPGAKPNVTILCYGGMLPDAERATDQLFADADIIAEVICPTQLYPLNTFPIIESVRQSGRLLIIEEGVSFAAFGAEVIAQIQEQAPGVLQRVMRVSSPAHPIPTSGPLEKELLPSDKHIIDAAKVLCS